VQTLGFLMVLYFKYSIVVLVLATAAAGGFWLFLNVGPRLKRSRQPD
jgi:hypothetical protein